MKHNLLFIDDSIANIFKKQFSNEYDIDIANSASEGLKLIIEKGQYAVVISDMKLPGMDGIEFFEKIKTLAPMSVRIMLTGNADLTISIDAINKGSIFQFLTKPCTRNYMDQVLKLSIDKYEFDMKLRNKSHTDALTGLWNRHYFDNFINQELIIAKKYSRIFSIIFIDINNFKHINDTLGHDTGDRAIVMVADVLKTTGRKSDIIVRFGGDEFVIFTRYEDRNSALMLVGRLKKEMLSCINSECTIQGISIAAGIATYPFEGTNISSLLKIADEEMYKDKRMEKELFKP